MAFFGPVVFSSLAATTPTLKITASDPDGTNTGTARLGVPVNFTTAITGPYYVRAWKLVGAGKLASSQVENANGTYTPPQAMPANPVVQVVAYLAADQSVQVTYTMTLVNPVPSISSTVPAAVLTGGTQPITLVGSGFVPATVLLHSGAVLATTYVDYNHVTVQLPVSNTAHGALRLQPSNPGAGNTGAIFPEPVITNSIALTAVDADGTNTGTARLGTPVNLSAAVTGSEQTAVNWSVTGSGSVSAAGTYTPPSVMPNHASATIVATLASNSAVTGQYNVTLINPVPIISSVSPSMFPPGATTTATLSGSGFVPQTTISASNATVTAAYQSPTSIVARVTVPTGASGNVSLQPTNPNPGGGAAVAYEQAIQTPVSATAAARILDQTTFGPTTKLISHVQQEGVNGWLEEQFNTPMTMQPAIPATFPGYCIIAAFCAESEWWQTALTGNDQLRQRVAFALSEMFVVSIDTVTGQAIPTYSNMLATDALGNWSNIMQDVALSPAMGVYLNMLNSPKASGTLIANENFARENLQLFNTGINLLNMDGTLKLDDDGNPIPAYTQNDIEAFAKVFTGWTYAWPDGSTPTSLIGHPNYWHPLVAVERFHDTSAKTLLKNPPLPAGQTAEEDFVQAMAIVFQHPNVPPFVSRQLIQHLVTGNPSPAYVERVAKVFANDGSDVRGDMKAVLTAIFTDPEARSGDTNPEANTGHLREPILYLTDVMRALGYTNIDPNDFYYNLSSTAGALGQEPYSAPSVFNFFPPSYVAPITGTNQPEFALENTGSIIGRLTLADNLVNNRIKGFNVDLSASSPLGQLASNPQNLVNRLSLLFLHNEMDPNTNTQIVTTISPITSLQQRVQVATYLVITSSNYKIQH